jgi:hypothetical protein
MIRVNRLLLAAVIVQTALVPAALADTGTKIVSGAVCQAQDPQDRANLRYFARGVQAVNKDVQIICPITRDSTLSAIKRVEVRYQRGMELPPQGSNKDQFIGQFEGSFFSCSNRDPGNACVEKSGRSGEHSTGDTTKATSVSIDTSGLKHDDHYYVYKAVLPEFAILKSITYVEQVK